MLTIGSLFAGIGGFDLGFERAGFKTVWQVEINEYCRKVLARHFPDAERYADIRECGAHNLKPVDVICGGFPCQDISNAGRRRGLSGRSSGLWADMLRVVRELRPAAVVIENSAHGKRHWLDSVCGDMQNAGFETVALEISAFDIGANHERRRCFVLAYSSSGRHGISKESLCAGWTLPESCSRWASESRVCRVDDGARNRVDRLRAIGNSVMPQKAELIARKLKEVLHLGEEVDGKEILVQ